MTEDTSLLARLPDAIWSLASPRLSLAEGSVALQGLCCSRANEASQGVLNGTILWAQVKTIQVIPHHKYIRFVPLWSLGRCCASHWLPRQQETQHVLPNLHICTEIGRSRSCILQSLFYLNSEEPLTVTLCLLDLLIKDSPACGPLLPVAIIAIKGEKTIGWVTSSVHKCIYYLS